MMNQTRRAALVLLCAAPAWAGLAAPAAAQSAPGATPRPFEAAGTPDAAQFAEALREAEARLRAAEEAYIAAPPETTQAHAMPPAQQQLMDAVQRALAVARVPPRDFPDQAARQASESALRTASSNLFNARIGREQVEAEARQAREAVARLRESALRVAGDPASTTAGAVR